MSDMQRWRRDLHAHPELAFSEHRTSDFVARALEGFGIDVHRGMAGTGVVGTLRAGTSRRAIGLRADMDALPVHEKTGCAYASADPGVMHACGHDGHTAMLLGAARRLAATRSFDGVVHFSFQPAEETVNAKGPTELATRAAIMVAGEENVRRNVAPSMGCEDFAFMLAARPGCYLWIGNGPIVDGIGLHSSRYDFNDAILELGARYWTRLAEICLDG